jgi:hypothetical protein
MIVPVFSNCKSTFFLYKKRTTGKKRLMKKKNKMDRLKGLPISLLWLEMLI